MALILIVAFTLNSRRSTPASNAVSATPTPTVATLPTVQASSEAPPAPTAQTAEVGASVPFVWSYLGAADRGVATLNSAAWSTDPGPYGSLKYGAVLNLDVTIEATAGTVDVNPFYWQAKDAEGRTYSIGMVMEPEPQLQSGNVRSGEKSRGWVSIEAPQGPVTVQLVDGLDSSPKAEWSVN